MDNITKGGECYRQGLALFLQVDGPGSGDKQRESWESAMREYQADPVAPIRRRFERLLKRLKKKCPEDEYSAVEDLCREIEECLQIVVNCRKALLGITDRAGVSVKKGIVI